MFFWIRFEHAKFRSALIAQILFWAFWNRSGILEQTREVTVVLNLVRSYLEVLIDAPYYQYQLINTASASRYSYRVFDVPTSILKYPDTCTCRQLQVGKLEVHFAIQNRQRSCMGYMYFTHSTIDLNLHAPILVAPVDGNRLKVQYLKVHGDLFVL